MMIIEHPGAQPRGHGQTVHPKSSLMKHSGELVTHTYNCAGGSPAGKGKPKYIQYSRLVYVYGARLLFLIGTYVRLPAESISWPITF